MDHDYAHMVVHRYMRMYAHVQNHGSLRYVWGIGPTFELKNLDLQVLHT